LLSGGGGAPCRSQPGAYRYPDVAQTVSPQKLSAQHIQQTSFLLRSF
jgi:hypothetical protein